MIKKQKTQANEALESKLFFHGCWNKQQQQKILYFLSGSTLWTEPASPQTSDSGHSWEPTDGI